MKSALVLELYTSLGDIPHIPDVVQNFEAFQQLPLNLLKEILLYQETDDEDEEIEDEYEEDSRSPVTKDRFDSFVVWLSKNNCPGEDKKVITDSFNFITFTVQELLTDVRKSNLYSSDMIDKRILVKVNSMERNFRRSINYRDSLIAQKKAENKFKDKTIKKMEDTIKQKVDKMKKCRYCHSDC